MVSNPRIWKEAASSPEQTWRHVNAWTASLLCEPQEFVPLLERFVDRPRVRGPIVHDSRIAALCMAHGVRELLTSDRDLSLFRELPTRNPFAA